jgi:hypothetical protein
LPLPRGFAVFASLLVAVFASSCNDEPAPNKPIPVNCGFPETDRPKETQWYSFLKIQGDSAGLNIQDTEATWVRASGLIDLDEGPQLRVAEPTVALDNICKIPLVDAIAQSASGTLYYLKPDQPPGARFLAIKYLSDDAISGGGNFQVYTDYEENGEIKREVADLTVQFEIVEDVCSPAEQTPDTSSYLITVGISGDSTGTGLSGTEAVWNPSIGVVVFGPTTRGSVEYGMNMRVVGPVRQSGDSCVVTLASAQLTVTKAGTPPDVLYYQFPTESGESAEQNDYLRVLRFTDVQFSGRGTIPMQRHDALGWLEKAQVTVTFDAFKP